MSKKVDVLRAYKKLPGETILLIDDYLSDDDLTLEEINIQYLIEAVEISIERLEMDMADFEDDRKLYNDYKKQQNQCKGWLKYYSKYA